MDNNNRQYMSEDQMNAIRQQMEQGGGQTPPPTPQPAPAQQPAQQTSQLTGQQAMRARMMAARGQQMQQTGQQVVLQQTESYQPEGQQPIQQAQPTGQQVTQQTQQTQQVQQNQTQPQQTTMINTTQEGGGFKPGKKLIFVIVGILLVFVIAAIVILGSDKKEETNTPDESLEDLEWLDPVNQETFLYSPEEITNLRAAGYTGDEIESYQSQQTPAEDLIKQAEAERDAWVQEAIAPLYDTASDEYKHYVSQTWLTLPQRTDMADWTMIGAEYAVDQNLDYEKIDVYGNQMFIKVYLDDNAHESWFFLNVSPTEWNQLNDAGNIQVHYTYVTHLVGDDYMTATEDFDDIYITSATLQFTNSGQTPGMQ